MPFRNSTRSRLFSFFVLYRDLARHGEEVRRVEPARLLIEPAGGTEEGKPERAPHVLHAGPQDAQRAAALDLGGQAPEKALLYLCTVVLGQLLPFLRLCGQDEVDDVAWQEAKLPVVVLGLAPVIAAGLRPGVVVECGFLGDAGFAREFVWAVAKEGGLDGVFEGAFGGDGVHEVGSGFAVASSRTSILPVTAAEIRAARSSLRQSMARRMSDNRASIFIAW